MLGTALHRGRRRVLPLQLHAVLVLATTLVALSVARATTPEGTVVTAVAFTWTAMYSAAFHSRGPLAAHLGLIGTGLAVGLRAAHATSPGQTWFFMMATIGCVAVVLHATVAQLRRQATTDALTGLLVRDAFRAVAEQELARASRTGELLLPSTDEREAAALLARLRGLGGPCLWSSGVARWRGETFDEWLHAADVELYSSKSRTS